MGNDLKYGLVLGAVVLLIFVGYYTLRVRVPKDEQKATIPSTGTERTRRPDLFLPPVTTEQPPAETIGQVPSQTIAIFENVPQDTAQRFVFRDTTGPGTARRPDPGVVRDTIGSTTLVGPRRLDFVSQVPLSAKTYKIQAGDTLGEISRKFYGTSEKWQKILDANKSKNLKPTNLVIGTEIVIPDVKEPVEDTGLGTGTREDRATGVSGAGKTHTVVAGDTLYALAEKYYGDGMKWKKIYDANKDKMSKPEDLKVGTALTIP